MKTRCLLVSIRDWREGDDIESLILTPKRTGEGSLVKQTYKNGPTFGKNIKETGSRTVVSEEALTPTLITSSLSENGPCTWRSGALRSTSVDEVSVVLLGPSLCSFTSLSLSLSDPHRNQHQRTKSNVYVFTFCRRVPFVPELNLYTHCYLTTRSPHPRTN